MSSKTKLPKGIQLRGQTYHARLTIPKDVREAIGLVEYTQSLSTSDIKVATVRGELLIRQWKKHIDQARGNKSPFEEALNWKHELESAK